MARRAQDQRGAENLQPVRQPAIQERRMDRRAALHQKARDTAPRQFRQDRFQVGPAAHVARDLGDLDAAGDRARRRSSSTS